MSNAAPQAAVSAKCAATPHIAPTTIVLLGASGQLGRCMAAELQQRWPQATLLSPTRAALDLTDLSAVVGYLQLHQPDWLINCAAFTGVDAAEQDPLFAEPFVSDVERFAALALDDVRRHPNTQLNAMLPYVLAQYWRSSDKPLTLLHYSTDYVYSGQGDMPWREDAPLAPLNRYGRAKACGDTALLQACAAGVSTLRTDRDSAVDAATQSRLYIVRTSWVYHRHGHNFINTMLKLVGERDVLRIVDDQVGAPTPAPWAAQISALLLQSDATSGVYHLAPAGATSWYGVAFAALSCAANLGLISQMPELVAITSQDYPLPASRPLNSRLDCEKLQRALGMEFPHWHRLLRDDMQRWLSDAG